MHIVNHWANKFINVWQQFSSPSHCCLQRRGQATHCKSSTFKAWQKREGWHTTRMVYLVNIELSLNLSLPFTSSPWKHSVLYVYLFLKQTMKRLQMGFLYRHHHVCWLHFMSNSPLPFTFTSPWLYCEIQRCLGWQTALQMLHSFLFQGHIFVVHQILHSVNNVDEVILSDEFWTSTLKFTPRYCTKSINDFILKNNLIQVKPFHSEG